MQGNTSEILQSMYSSPAMTRLFRHIVLVCSMSLITSLAKAQFVNFRLEIPAGVSFSTRVLDPMSGGTWENNKAKVWIEIQAQENLSYLLDIRFPEQEIEPPLEAFYLNDGTASFENAVRLRAGVQELQLINPPILIRNTSPRLSYFQAWLGLPIVRGLSIKIEYP